ncbi:xseA protein [Weissella kandleri]|uniref:Exodeoxyribonuclease 7 large subunit n=1 Tax=Weissella kandleri TaxID=1616 RepID=A0A0R2JLA1_9LACO|nr:exodeoxyribonuclease VII large subunit [Weissella kandleri]KRN75564.1 xseA protein [Weissella kandleri]
MAEYLTVSALTQYLKRKFVADPYLKEVYLTGEVSNFRPRSKHQYFSIKDEHAVINATLFQGVYRKLPFQLEAGMRVNVVGHIDLYAPNGGYSIIIERIEPDGVGALAVQYEQLKRKLETEGLFQQNQRAIPAFPKKIAVITSPSGAVIQDIRTTVQRRYPIAQIYLYPAVVQGQGSVPNLLQQLKRVAQVNYDVLIIGRGGGSIEDLWAFNDEQLARQLVQMPMPMISSVGHETDTTIADFIADQRAATPTAAAEIATPVLLTDLFNELNQTQMRMINSLSNRLNYLDERLTRVQQSAVLQQPTRLYEGLSRRVDLAQDRLAQMFKTQLTQNQHRLALIMPRLNNAMQRQIEQKQTRYARAVHGLDLMSPLAVLARGYSVTTNQNQQVVRQVGDVATGDQVYIQVNDGQILAQVTEIKKEND